MTVDLPDFLSQYEGSESFMLWHREIDVVFQAFVTILLISTVYYDVPEVYIFMPRRQTYRGSVEILEYECAAPSATCWLG